MHVPFAGTLDVWRLASYGGGLFVPVKDALAGRPGGTYGGGRYLIDTIKGADLGANADDEATLVLDFNFAYNPSCAYDPAWACPLAQAGNTLRGRGSRRRALRRGVTRPPASDATAGDRRPATGAATRRPV